jgi:glycosyltransferase involved in cell wall biosynthesis
VASAPPAISVVIPAWDEYVGEWLAAAIESVRAQGIPVELVVVDNASSRPVEARAGVRILRLQKRVSLGRARNEGVRSASAPDVVVWDADDVMLPGTLEALVRARARRPESVAAAARIVEDEAGTPHRWPRRWSREVTRSQRVLTAVHAVWSVYPTTGAVLMSRAALLDGGGYGDSESGDDWVAGMSLVLRGPVLHVAHDGRLYRQHQNSVWDRYGSTEHLMGHATAVRERLRIDPATPTWLKAALPVVGMLQVVAVRMAHARRAVIQMSKTRLR